MKSDDQKDKLNELLSMLTQSDKEAVPRIIILDQSNNKWKEDITKAIDMDINIFKTNNFVVTCKRSLDNGAEPMEFKGNLCLALHNVLSYIDKNESMIITVQNIVSTRIKGVKATRTIKLVYIVLQS